GAFIEHLGDFASRLDLAGAQGVGIPLPKRFEEIGIGAAEFVLRAIVGFGGGQVRIGAAGVFELADAAIARVVETFGHIADSVVEDCFYGGVAVGRRCGLSVTAQPDGIRGVLHIIDGIVIDVGRICIGAIENPQPGLVEAIGDAGQIVV